MSITPIQAADPKPAVWIDEDDADAFDDDTLFVVGNTLFTVYHELGHALIDLLKLPVIGREEDAVDGFAAVTMIPETPDDIGDALIVAVADAWSVQSDLASEGMDRRYWDEHALDQQRHFAVVCLMVGSDQDGFYDYALDSGLPEERIRTCPYDFTRMKEGWQHLLEPHRRQDDAADGALPIEAPITVVFDEPSPEQEGARDLARRDGLLEDAIAGFGETIALPSPVTIRFTACNEANAYWSPRDREVKICYELVDEFEATLLGAVLR
ncbi:MAG: DUF4344 domain-containing metallopeptidase [Alphaproteobacteria bacterium]